MIACSSGAMYTTYVQGQTSFWEIPHEATRGVIHNTPLINGDRLSFQVEDQNKNIVQLSYKMKSALEKKQMRQLHAGVSCVFEGERKEPQIARISMGLIIVIIYISKIFISYWTLHIFLNAIKHRCHSCNGFFS